MCLIIIQLIIGFYTLTPEIFDDKGDHGNQETNATMKRANSTLLGGYYITTTLNEETDSDQESQDCFFSM
jgi:hypothetical protein